MDINDRISDYTAFIMRAMIAGLLIALCSLIYCVCIGTSKVLGSFLFSLGLISVIAQEVELYTGRIGYATWRGIPKLAAMLICNLAGVAVIGLCVPFTRIYPAVMEAADTLMAVKCNDTPLSLFILGIGCGMMMYLAVDSYAKTKHLLCVVLPVMFFIICGFEHCIADAGYYVLSSCRMTPDVFAGFMSVVAGNTVGSIILYRCNRKIRNFNLKKDIGQ